MITGKTHQIRAHLAALGHPILGDRKYGGNRRGVPECSSRMGLRPSRQMLHAWELRFPDPLPELPQLAGRRFFAPLPEDFCRALERLGIPLPESGGNGRKTESK